jgi:plasmid stabilization system protein ParE
LAFKIILTEQAVASLESLLDYIGADNPEAAGRLGNALLNHIVILASFPHLGTPVRKHTGVRSILHTPGRIYYRVDEPRRAIEVLHFWHTARRPPSY